MKLGTVTGTSTLLLGFLLTFGFAAPSYAQDQHDDADKPKKQEPTKPQDTKPEHEGQPKQQAQPPKTPNEQPRPDKEARPPKEQPQAEQPKTDKQSKQAEKQNEQQQKEQQKQYGQQRQYTQQQGGEQARNDGGGGGGRIPEDRYRAHFGREHHFHVGHPQIVEGRPHFEYGGYSFIIVQAWPADWGYGDDVYIVDDGGVYYLCDVAHPGVQLELSVVL
jgi:DNA mismatch repair ATPase MutL